MKHLYLNLKRFDVLPEFGGVNRIAPIQQWGAAVVRQTQQQLDVYNRNEVEFVQFFPEAHLISALHARNETSSIKIGCQGIYRRDVDVANFGTFTTNFPAAAAKAMGISTVLIGHCEERKDKQELIDFAGVSDSNAVNQILNQEIKAAQNRGLDVLYCVGENSEEHSNWEQVLSSQLQTGLMDVDLSKIVIAYEPIWAIGPGKTPASKEYLTEVVKFIKSVISGVDVVYGGGLKEENAQMLSSIEELDGGLIALTRFDGEIGFYPDEYLRIIELYLGREGSHEA